MNKILVIGLSREFQDELENAVKSMDTLVAAKSNGQHGEMHDIFGFFIIFTINQMNMLNTNLFNLCNTDRAVTDCWSLIKKSFVINAITLTYQFIASNGVCYSKNKKSDKGIFLMEGIKCFLSSTRISKNERNKYTGFFQALNTLRNYYGHFPPEINDNEIKDISKYLPFIMKSAINTFPDTYPNDIYMITNQYYEFLDLIESKDKTERE